MKKLERQKERGRRESIALHWRRWLSHFFLKAKKEEKRNLPLISKKERERER